MLIYSTGLSSQAKCTLQKCCRDFRTGIQLSNSYYRCWIPYETLTSFFKNSVLWKFSSTCKKRENSIINPHVPSSRSQQVPIFHPFPPFILLPNLVLVYGLLQHLKGDLTCQITSPTNACLFLLEKALLL